MEKNVLSLKKIWTYLKKYAFENCFVVVVDQYYSWNGRSISKQSGKVAIIL